MTKKTKLDHVIVKEICYLYERKFQGRCDKHNKPKPKSKINQGKRNDLK
jgi:hypothetical protein